MNDKKNFFDSFYNNCNDDNTNNINDLENYINNLDISLANLEALGASLLAIGYAYFFYSAILDKMQLNDIDINGEKPSSVILYGQQLSLMGYIVLWIVALKRIYGKEFENNNLDGDNCLLLYETLANSYLLSIIANAIRVQVFAQLNYLDKM